VVQKVSSSRPATRNPRKCRSVTYEMMESAWRMATSGGGGTVTPIPPQIRRSTPRQRPAFATGIRNAAISSPLRTSKTLPTITG
jgi:hypothetical protein